MQASNSSTPDSLEPSLGLQQATATRAEEIFQKHRLRIFKSTDRLFAGLMLFQWIAGIVAALVISPRTWSGEASSVHPHVWAAVFLGAAINVVPIFLALTRPGEAFTRYTIAVAQMLMSALLVHLSGGRLETHFHIFGSLVILSFYRDWRVLIPATVVVALDHFVRGMYFPQSAYGVLEASPWRSVEHAAWVLFEDVFLVGSCVRSVREMRAIANNTAQLEITNQVIEEKVVQRTAEVKSSEERFRLLVDGVQDYAVIMLDCEGCIVSWNEGARRIQGYTTEEIIGKHVSCFYSKDDVHDGLPTRALSVAREHGRFENEGWRFRKDGSKFWANAVYTALHDETGELRGFSKVTRDITERKRAEVALQKAHDEMETRVVQRTAELAQANDDLHLQKTILEAQGEASIDGILIVSNEGKTVSFNRRFTEIWEIPPEIIAPRSDEAVLQWVLNKVDDPEPFHAKVTYLYEHPDEESQDELVLKNGCILDRYSAPVRGEDGTHYGRIWFFRDITERKQSEAAIHQAKEEAERANRAKSEFLSRMSHELRTPLNAILGFAQVMKMRDMGPQEQEGLNHILKGGRHLLALINEVLDISRIEAGRMPLSPEPIPVSQVANDVLSLVLPLATPQQITLVNKVEQSDGSGNELHVLADHQRLKQVLLNLLANAIKYNRPQGKVVLSCETTSPSTLRLTVRDTGVGLSPADIEKLFVPFERLRAVHSQIEGTGMGLALSKRLIEAMGGHIGVESTIGEGSRFWIELPVAEGPLDRQKRLLVNETIAEPLPLAVSEEAKRTVLYIEDNLSNLKLMEYMLSGRPDVKLLSAMQGSIGLEMASRHQPDLILLDLHLPDILGDEVLRRLQSNPQTEQIPVVMVSADATLHEIERLMAAGARDYLTKPLDVSHCMQVLKDTLEDTDQ
jgi:PAS domain S-box-containing protein